MLAFGGCLHKFVGVGVHPLIPSACLKFSCSQLVEQFDDSIACTFISGKNGLDLREKIVSILLETLLTTLTTFFGVGN